MNFHMLGHIMMRHYGTYTAPSTQNTSPCVFAFHSCSVTKIYPCAPSYPYMWNDRK